jgi:hypothetical protein
MVSASTLTLIIQGVGSGDAAAARKAILKMGRIGRGLDSDDEGNSGKAAGSGSGSGSDRNNLSSDVVVVRSGKKFLVRKKIKGDQYQDLGRLVLGLFKCAVLH